MSGRECPAPGCARRIPTSMFACRMHWYQVPKELRDEVTRAWAAVLRGLPGALQAHTAAKAKAEHALAAGGAR